MKGKRRSLSTTVLAVTVVVYVPITIAMLLLIQSSERSEALDVAHAGAERIIEGQLAVHHYFAQELKPSVFALAGQELPADYFDARWMSSTHAVLAMQQYLVESRKAGYSYKECAINARSPENEASAFERRFLERAAGNPAVKEWAGVREIDGEPYYVVLRRGETMEASCLRCHGDPAEAPRGLVMRYGNTHSFGRKEGDLVSALSVRIPLSLAFASADRNSGRLGLGIAGLLAAILVALHLVGRSHVYRPLDRLSRAVARAGEDEALLGKPIATGGAWEIQRVADGFAEMSARVKTHLSTLEEQVAERTAHVDAANAQLAKQDDTLAEKDAALRMSEARLDLALNAAHMGVWSWDIEENKRHCDDQVCRLLGINPQTFSGTPEEFYSTVHPDDREGLREALARTAAEGVAYEPNYRVVWPDGSIHHLMARGARACDERGRPTRVNAILVDMTAARQLEEQLRHSQKMEALGTLAGGIAHDFNNILAAILGYSELLKTRVEKGTEDEEDINEVLSAARRARDLVKQILTFSRKNEEARRLVPAHQVVEEALGLLRQTIPATVDIKRAVAKDHDTVLADPTQLHQIVMNLCTNAYHALHDGTGTLTVSLEPVEADSELCATVPGLAEGPYVRLSVADTGDGMTPEVQARVFEPFFTTKPVGKGTGMGLAVVHGIVMSHRGAVTIHSRPKEGTRIDVYLPRHKDSQRQESDRVLAVATKTGRVLVVDDERAVAKMMAKTLEALGYRADFETDSRACLQRFRENPDAYDVVITDHAMPGLSGAALAEALRTIRPELPIILCTGYSDVLTPQRAKEIGARALLPKPIDRQALARLMREVLEG